MGYERKIDLMDPSIMALEHEIEERRHKMYLESYQKAMKQRGKVQYTDQEIINSVVKEMSKTL